MIHALALVALLSAAPLRPLTIVGDGPLPKPPLRFTEEQGVRPADRPDPPEIEALVVRLRERAEFFATHAPAELALGESIAIYHDLWIVARNGARLKRADARLAADLRTLADAAHTAAHCAMHAAPAFRVDLRTSSPDLQPGDEARCHRLVRQIIANGDEAARALNRIVARYPLVTADGVWSYHP